MARKWGRYFGRHITKKDIEIADKYVRNAY